MWKRLFFGLLCMLPVAAGYAQVPTETDSLNRVDTAVVVEQKPFLKDTIPKYRYRFAWEREPRRNMIQWNFFSSFVQTANFSYERIVGKYVGILLGGYVGNYTLTSRGDSLPYDTKIFTAAGYLELKAYPWGGQGRGAYIGPYTSFRFLKLRSPEITGMVGDKYTYGDFRAESYNLSVGGVVGYRFILGNWFLINLFGGAGYNIPRFHFFGDAQPHNFNTRLLFVGSYEVRFGMNLGLAIK